MIDIPDTSRLEPLVHQDADIVLRAVSLTKTYTTGRGELELFKDLSLEVRVGEMVAIVGESGVGKSSLLHLLAALDRPSSGEVFCGKSRLSQFRPPTSAIGTSGTYGNFTISCLNLQRSKM